MHPFVQHPLLGGNQDDQMSLRKKNAQNASQPNYLSTFMLELFVGRK
jgi:hypothetical protein